MKMTTEEIIALEKTAEHNDGRCDKCHQTIKIYRYKLNKTHAQFLQAMAEAVRVSDVNDVDISTIKLIYSVRSQCTKMRQHGLIARVKNDKGAQIPRRWLITRKGFEFLNGKSIPSKVIVYNNQVLGHSEDLVRIYDLTGKFDPVVYEEVPVSPAEARTYDNVRDPKRMMEVRAVYKGAKHKHGLDVGATYDLVIEKLRVGFPVVITMPEKITYKDIAAFQKEWKAI